MSALPQKAKRTLLGQAFLRTRCVTGCGFLLSASCTTLLVGCTAERDCAATLTCPGDQADGSAVKASEDDKDGSGGGGTPSVAVSVPLEISRADAASGDGGGRAPASAGDASAIRADAGDDSSEPSGSGGTPSLPVGERRCESNEACNAEAPVCDEELGRCVVCLLEDGEGCPPERPFCVGPSNASSVCVECEGQDDCGGATPFCNLSGECVGCATGDDCAEFPDTPLCSDDGQCVGCLSEADCGPESAACDDGGQCVGCSNDDDCARFADAPACDTDTGTCVECADNADCTDPTLARCEDSVCKSCETADECAQFPGLAACNTTTGECVECASLGDCNDPLAADCVEDRCVPCEYDIACVHLAGGYSVCDSGECVMCTGAKDEYCGWAGPDYVCHAEYRVCADNTPENVTGAAELCEPCLSDVHCAAGKTCVQTEFEGAMMGWHCQWEVGAEGAPTDCADANPYVETRVADTRSGRQDVTVCGLRTTSCPAVLDHLLTPCVGIVFPYPPECGDPDAPDALCVQIGGSSLCTIRCIDDTDCPSGQSCSSNGWFCLPD